MKLKINNEMLDKIINNTLKAKELVKYVIDNTGGITQKELHQTALQDIKINDKYIKNVLVDTWKKELVIEF